jgi:uncharacterized protein YjdB
MKNHFLRLAAAAAMAVAFACGGDDDAPASVPVAGVDIAQPSAKVPPGATVTFTATVLPADAADKRVNWTMSGGPAFSISATSGESPHTVTVTVSGSAADGDSAAVTATSAADPARSFSRGVTVDTSVPVTGVTVSPKPLTVIVGANPTLAAALAPADATNQAVAWSSSNADVATVAGSGLTAQVRTLAVGAATITATTADGGRTDACALTVVALPVASVTVSPATLRLAVGAAPRALAAAVFPAAASQDVIWESSAASVATVSGSGLAATVAPLAAGDATITVRSAADATKRATCQVTVAPPTPVTGLRLPATLGVRPGGTAKLLADVLPYDASNRAVNWTSSNTSAVTVSGSGGASATLTGLAAGTAIVTAASAAAPSVTATCTVTVTANMTSELYWATNYYGMLVNDTLDAAYEDCTINRVFVDHAGDVHAVGDDESSLYYAPVYFRNGVKTLLSPAVDGLDAVASCVYVDYAGRVYIGGYMIDYGSETISAKLWIDGVPVVLPGSDEFVLEEVNAVFAAGGNVYAVGWQSADGESYSAAALWVQRQGGPWTKTNLVGDNYAAWSVAALGNDVYVGGGHGLIRLSPDEPLNYSYVPGYEATGAWDMEILDLRLVGEDIYAAGWVQEDPVVWKNHVRTVLPWDDGSYAYAEARGVAVALDGSVYVSGGGIYYWDEPLMWKDGQALTPPDALWDPYYNYNYLLETVLNSVAVRETPIVAATGVSVPATLAVDARFTATLTASALPANATDKRVTFTSGNEAVAVIESATGNTATIRGLVPGTATITVRAASNPSASATCTVTVRNVPVTSVTLPPTFTVQLNHNLWIEASVLPANASNLNLTWSSSNASVVEATGVGTVGVVHGNSLGTATITARSQAYPEVFATCSVTVTPAPEPSVYYVGEFGMYEDGKPDLAINDGMHELSGIYVTETGHVHASGWYHNALLTPPWQAAYFYDDGQTILPTQWGADELESDAWDMTYNAANGDVHIAGSEIRPGTITNYDYMATWWKNGVQQTLEGAGAVDGSGNMLSSQAMAVRVHNGDVYVAGFSQGTAGGPSIGTIWKNGARHQFPNITGYIKRMVITADGVIYCRTGDTGGTVYRIPAATLASAESVTLAEPGGTYFGLAAYGNDWYMAGYSGLDGVVWKNGVRTTLPRGGVTWTEANTVHVHNGVVYVGGVRSDGGFYYLQTWKDGVFLPTTDPTANNVPYSSYLSLRPYNMFVR